MNEEIKNNYFFDVGLPISLVSSHTRPLLMLLLKAKARSCWGNKRVVGGVKASGFSVRIVQVLTLLLALLFVNSYSLAEVNQYKPAEGKLYSINVPQLNVADALNGLAEQTGVTFLFPYEIAETQQAKKVLGRFTLMQALTLLLEGSAFTGGLTESGVVVISLKYKSENGKGINMNSKKKLLATTIAFFVGSSGAQSGLAQDVDQQGATQQSQIDEIIVTARFREESVQDIGASIVGIGGDELARQGISDFDDLAKTIAGVQNFKFRPNANDISIRGVSNGFGVSTGGSFSSSSLLSISYDDIPVTSRTPLQRDFNAFDLNRVEILRGPQPTLFGEGAVGGAVRYFSQDPDLDGPAISGKAHLRFENIDDGGVALRGENATTFNLIPGKLGVRLTGFFRDDDGFIDNPTAGVDDANDFRSTGGSGVLLARPTEDLEIRLSAYISGDDIGEISQIDAGSNPDALVLSTPTIVGATVDDFEVYSGRVSYDFGAIKVTSITGYSDRDLSIVAIDVGNTVALAPFFPTIDTTIFSNVLLPEESFSQEFRFISDFDGPLNFVAGLFYRNREFSQAANLAGDGYIAVTTPSQAEILNNVRESQSDQYSGFVELTYEVTDSLRLIGGGRYLNEQLTSNLVVDSTINFGPPFLFTETSPIDFSSAITTLTNAGFDTEFEFELDDFLPKFGIEYDLTDSVLLYANYAEGIRNGGLNQPIAALTVFNNAGASDFDVFTNALVFSEDNLQSIDWGAKTVWLDGDLLLNIGMFYSSYDDTQLSVNVPAAMAVNGPDQTIKGLELETLYHFNESVSAFFNLSLLDGEFDGNLATANTAALGVPFDIAEGNEPINVPSVSFSVGYDFRHPVGQSDLELVGHGSFQYIGERFGSNQNFPSSELDSLENLNLRLGVQNEKFSLMAFVTNATNDIEIVTTSANALGAFLNASGDLDANPFVSAVNRPRTFGVEITVNY